MAEENHAVENLTKVLNWGCDALEKMGVPYVLTGGTMLGLHREGRPLKHDYDIDVDVLAEDVGDTKEFRKRLMDATGIHEGDRVVFRDNYFTVYYQFDNEPKQVPFDVFMMFKKGNKRYKHFFNEGENPDTEKCLIWPENYYYKDTWTTIKYNGRKYPVYKDTVGWIEEFFGKDWKTPDTEWRWGNADNCYIFGEYKKWEE